MKRKSIVNYDKRIAMMLLAGDIGGTKTLLGLFEPFPVRPRPIMVRSYVTSGNDDLPAMIFAFMQDVGVGDGKISSACFGVAGPVIDETAQLTNVPWRVDARRVSMSFNIRRVTLLNDLEAMAYAVPVLDDSELHVLQEGMTVPGGNMALIAAGTGLGEALLHNIGGRLVPSASEGGHADFAARTEREIGLLRSLTARHGRVDVERIVSGRGLLNVHRELHAMPCAADVELEHPDAAAHISAAALAGTCPACVDTLDLFVEAYAAEAGNLALRTVATGGVYISGGIAPKILPALTTGTFMKVFCAKPPLETLLAAMPVKVVLNPESALVGSAVFAAGG
jgi:glucokinase